MTAGYVADIKKAAKNNEHFREVVYTGPKSQLVLMALRPGEEIGLEVHDGDQVLSIVDGEGFAVLDGAKKDIAKGSIVFVPAGVRHNIVNREKPMKLFTVYAPPQHKPGTIQSKKPRNEEKGFSELEAQLAE